MPYTQPPMVWRNLAMTEQDHAAAISAWHSGPPPNAQPPANSHMPPQQGPGFQHNYTSMGYGQATAPAQPGAYSQGNPLPLLPPDGSQPLSQPPPGTHNSGASPAPSPAARPPSGVPGPTGRAAPPMQHQSAAPFIGRAASPAQSRPTERSPSPP